MRIKDKAREDDGQRQEMVLTMVASPEEVDAAAERFFADISKRDIPGFRKGKAPREVLEQSVGGHENAMGGVAETLINELALAALDEDGTVFLEEPTFNVDTVLETGKPFTFTVSGPVAPLMTLTNFDSVEIKMPTETATPDEVEARLREIQDFYHSFEDIEDEDHTAQMGDYVTLKMTVTNHGKVVSGLSSVTRMIGLGEGTMPASFDENIIGAKVGDVLEFDFEAKDEQGGSEYGDGDLHAVVDVQGFRRCITPELDDALAAKVGCTDVADMRKQAERTLNMQKAEERPRLLVDRSVDAALEHLDGEVPAYYVDHIRQDVGREFMQDLQNKGVDLQQWMLSNAVDGDNIKEDIAAEAARRAAIDCMLEAVFTEKQLELTDEDIEAIFEGEEDAAEARKKWEDAHRMADIKKMARQRKAAQWLADTATIVEE